MYATPSLRRNSEPRRGLILMVVLALLTAFAIVGLSFVLYADSEAKAAQIAREAEQGLVVRPYDLDPKAALSNFLGQLIHDADDDTMANSALRGHSLTRGLFGYNYTLNAGFKVAVNNTNPFNGVGRLHNTLSGLPASFSGTSSVDLDEFNWPNYRDFSSIDGFIRDPERPGFRPAGSKAPWLCGFNAPYTYPDLNNMFLAQMDSSGNVVQPSYYRQSIFGPLDGGNPKWSSPVGKYQILRPRPNENPGFGLPEDAGGDVKNLLGNPGGNDSLWTDIGSPVRTAPNGKTYKALFAPLIVELDSRLNLSVHGNVLGGTDASNNSTHISSTGWGPWSVNLSQALKDYTGTNPAAGTDWGHLFTGIPLPKKNGRYGPDKLPGSNGTVGTTFPFTPGQAGVFPAISAKGYSKVDFDEGNVQAGPPITRQAITAATKFLPSTTAGYFPPYQAPGYQTSVGATQLTNHPQAYNLFASNAADDDRVFSLNSMEALLRFNDSTSYSLSGDLLTLCPNLFGQQRPRNLVTTRGFDVDVPGLAPAFSARTGSFQLLTGKTRPEAGAATFPNTTSIPASPNSDFATGDGRMSYTQPSLAAGLVYALSKRLDLNRPLPDYPQPTNGIYQPADMPKFQAATQARQDLAKDIFDRLRLITGANDPGDITTVPAAPATTPFKDGLRWLAQLSVNIVDFIDNDDIMTPFPWCAPGGGTAEYVYGTELPKLLINEVVVQYKNPTSGADLTKTLVDVWVELMNPSNQDATLLPDNGGVRVFNNGTFNPYQVSVCTSGSYTTLTNPANVAGVPDTNFVSPASPPSLIQTTTTGGTTPCQVTDFSAVTGGVVLPYNSGAPAGQGFLVLGNSTPLTTTGATGITATVNSPNLSYKLSPQTTSPLAPTIILQRLACPYMPAGTTNPYITVDIFQNACNFTSSEGPLANNVTNPQTNSDNRPNPFMNHLGGGSNLRGKETTSGSGSIKNSFGSLNFNETGATNQWLVHLDRYLSSPMEILHVSGFKPQELTQYFGDASVTQMGQFNHRVPWFDEDLGGVLTSSHRLYRFFELVETRSRMAGMDPAVFQPSSAIGAGAGTISVTSLTTITSNGNVVTIGAGDVLTIMATDGSGAMENVRVAATTSFPPSISLVPGTFGATPYQTINNPILIHTTTGGRVAGKINLNSVFDAEVFQALCDPTDANQFTQTDVNNIFGTGLPSATGIMAALHPSYTVTGGALSVKWTGFTPDQPFSGMGTAQFVSPPAAGDLLQLTTSGVSRTYFRPTGAAPFSTLFEPALGGANSHPYTRFELLNKIYNNTTSRSNVFAVWLTVGFFEVDPLTGALGAEIGKSEGKSIRHRMFAIVDRTGLAVPRQATTVAANVAANQSVATFADLPSSSTIIPGTQLLIGNPGSNMELVTVLSVIGTQIQLTPSTSFTLQHNPGEPVFIAPGNWGPQPGFDVTQPVNREIVPYFSIIE